MSAKLLKAPLPSSVRLISFTKARIVPGIVKRTWILMVSGNKPCFNMTVRLSPLIYVRQPEYWGIEVVGISAGVLPACYRALYSLASTRWDYRHARRGSDRIK